MKKIKKFRFRRLEIIKLSGAHYVNSFMEKSIYIIVDGVKYFKVSKTKLRAMGVIFAEDRATPSTPSSDTAELPSSDTAELLSLDFPDAA
jgi:hypothetical protein